MVRIITTLLLSIMVISGCKTTTNSPESLSSSLNIEHYQSINIHWPNNITNSKLIAETVLSQLRLQEHRNIIMYQHYDNDTNTYIIEILQQIPLSSAQSSVIYRILLTQNKHNFWRLVAAKKAIKCRYSTTHKYSNKACSHL